MAALATAEQIQRGSQCPVGAPGTDTSDVFSPAGQERPDWRTRTLELHDSLNRSIHRYLRSLGLSADDADDALQEAFLRLAGHLKQGGDDDNLRSWLFQVAHNLSMDTHRASRRNRQENQEPRPVLSEEPVDPRANPEHTYIQKEQAKRLVAGISQLTLRQRNSLLLRAEGLRYREIAALLGVSEQRAIYLVKRSLLHLTGGL